MQTEADLYVGALLDNRWRIDGEQGSGFFSTVLHGIDVTTNAPIAVKILKIGGGAEAEEELRGEISLLEELGHCDRVVDIRGHGKHPIILNADGPTGVVSLPVVVNYLVLELAAASLTDLLVVLDGVSWNERLSLFRDVVKGAHQMHLRRIVSRDLKSDNVLLFPSSVSTVAKVADLGRARRTTDVARFDPTAYLTGRGDLRFAPPELLWWQGIDDAQHWVAVDLYLLGSILFELAVGHGLTALVLPDALAIVREMSAVEPEARASDYRAHIVELRAHMQFAWEVFDSEVPPSIRPQAAAVLRQLTDPDPCRRFPRALGRLTAPGPGLEWLIRRIGILRLTLRNSATQAARLEMRKKMRNVTI